MSSSTSLEKADSKPKRLLNFYGLKIGIETDKGEVRHWFDKENGRKGETTMKFPYGYFLSEDSDNPVKIGKDGDSLDVFVGPEVSEDKEYDYDAQIYVVTQKKPNSFKEVDEEKVLIGFPSPKAALAAYMEHYDDPRFLGKLESLSIDQFKNKYVNKSLDSTTESDTVYNQEDMQMLYPQIDINDLNSIDGVDYWLSNFASLNPKELEDLSHKLWGEGYAYSAVPEELIRAEALGCLLDARELLKQEQNPMTIQPSQETPTMQPSQDSLDSSQPSSNGLASSEDPSSKVSLSNEDSQKTTLTP